MLHKKIKMALSSFRSQYLNTEKVRKMEMITQSIMEIFSNCMIPSMQMSKDDKSTETIKSAARINDSESSSILILDKTHLSYKVQNKEAHRFLKHQLKWVQRQNLLLQKWLAK